MRRQTGQMIKQDGTCQHSGDMQVLIRMLYSTAAHAWRLTVTPGVACSRAVSPECMPASSEELAMTVLQADSTWPLLKLLRSCAWPSFRPITLCSTEDWLCLRLHSAMPCDVAVRWLPF